MKILFLIIVFCLSYLPLFACEHDEHDVNVTSVETPHRDVSNLKEKKKKKNKKTKITKPADDDVVLELDDEEDIDD